MNPCCYSTFVLLAVVAAALALAVAAPARADTPRVQPAGNRIGNETPQMEHHLVTVEAGSLAAVAGIETPHEILNLSDDRWGGTRASHPHRSDCGG
jgi:hypothetical protein